MKYLTTDRAYIAIRAGGAVLVFRHGTATPVADTYFQHPRIQKALKTGLIRITEKAKQEAQRNVRGTTETGTWRVGGSEDSSAPSAEVTIDSEESQGVRKNSSEGKEDAEKDRGDEDVSATSTSHKKKKKRRKKE